MAFILIIEDNDDIRENTIELLELEEHTVISANNGKIGLEIALKNAVELIICDIHMPEMNGYEVLKKLRQEPSTENLPFIFLTALTEPKDIQLGLDEGATCYLKKPFEGDELLAAIEACLP